MFYFLYGHELVDDRPLSRQMWFRRELNLWNVTEVVATISNRLSIKSYSQIEPRHTIQHRRYSRLNHQISFALYFLQFWRDSSLIVNELHFAVLVYNDTLFTVNQLQSLKYFQRLKRYLKLYALLYFWDWERLIFCISKDVWRNGSLHAWRMFEQFR